MLCLNIYSYTVYSILDATSISLELPEYLSKNFELQVCKIFSYVNDALFAYKYASRFVLFNL